ncbi:MAG: hypothetical protein RBS35_10365 [Azonexus sp.]|nr:hypothetical protein [Azonexus sp.]
MMLRISTLLLCATMAMPCSAESVNMDDFDKLKPSEQLRVLNRKTEKTTPLEYYYVMVDGWEILFQAPADGKPDSAWLTPVTDTRSELYTKTFKSYVNHTGNTNYTEGVFSFIRGYKFGLPFLNSSRLGQLDVNCELIVFLDKSDWPERYRQNFMVPDDLLKEFGRSYRSDYMVRSYHDGKLYPAGTEVNEIIIDGRKWVHKWHLSEIGSSETYYTALAKERVLKINIQYNFFIPEKYYHPDSPRPGWMKSAYESVNTIMSSIRLKPPPGYDEEADPYIVKPAKAQQ